MAREAPHIPALEEHAIVGQADLDLMDRADQVMRGQVVPCILGQVGVHMMALVDLHILDQAAHVMLDQGDPVTQGQGGLVVDVHLYADEQTIHWHFNSIINYI